MKTLEHNEYELTLLLPVPATSCVPEFKVQLQCMMAYVCFEVGGMVLSDLFDFGGSSQL